MLVEEVERPLPGELCRLLVVARRRVVVEAVLRAVVDEQLIVLLVFLERRLVGRDPLADAGVLGWIGIVQHHRRLDLRGVLRAERRTVERRAGAELAAEPNGEAVDHGAPRAGGARAGPAGAVGTLLQPLR